MARLLDSIGHQMPDNFLVAVATGNVPGWRVHRKFGMNADVPATGSEEIWPPGTARVLPTSAAVLAVTSDSAEDDPDEATPPGTGAWTIIVEGLDANYDEISETITMAGTGTANSSAAWFRVNRAYVNTAGSTQSNVGNISISISGDLQGYIEAAEGQTHMTHYTVPNGHTVIVTGFSITVGRMAGNTDLQVESQIKLAHADSGWRTVDDQWLYGPIVDQNENLGFFLPEKTEVRQQVTSTSATQVGSTWKGYLIKNDTLKRPS